jgi:chemotaxis protein methyltransferase CheR
MDATIDEFEYSFIKREMLSLTGVDLNCYKTSQMQRRLNTYLLRSGQVTWRNFFRGVQNDPAEVGKLKDYLTINVSSFFRDLDKFKVLQEAILPELLRGRSSLHLWSAGCSRGHEPYSLAIMLSELTTPYRRHHILATDLDQSALQWARAGGPYTAEDVANLPSALLDRYFEVRAGAYYVIDSLRRRIDFRQHNLLADPFAALEAGGGGFDLIVCRNVVIYFTPVVKDRLYRHFYHALRPGGILFVGGTEIIPQAAEIGFESAGISFYRRKHTC